MKMKTMLIVIFSLPQNINLVRSHTHTHTQNQPNPNAIPKHILYITPHFHGGTQTHSILTHFPPKHSPEQVLNHHVKNFSNNSGIPQP